MSVQAIIDGYARDACRIIPRFAAISTCDVLRPVAGILPAHPSRVLAVGVGTGHEAGWLASCGHEVVAVEPVDELRHAGISIHGSRNIVWVNDRLPTLAKVARRREKYDLILLIAVWQHIHPESRLAAVRNLSALLASGGQLVMSVRDGPGAPSRHSFVSAPRSVIDLGHKAGLKLLVHRSAPSVQMKNKAAGVSWNWLSLGCP